MGRNKDLHKKIAGCRRVIEVHQKKISGELMRPHPSDTLIAGWQREIETQERRAALLTRRLKREW